jgi:hypothetical protein
MTNYNEQSATATTSPYRRVRYIGIRNPPGGLPTVEVLEADAVILNGRKIHLNEGVGGIHVAMDAAALDASFPLLNPVTDEPLGESVTGAQLFVFIYSWARAQQAKRDAVANQ